MDEIGGFSSRKTSCLALHLYEIGPSGVPVNEMVLVLVSPFMKAVFMESISAEQTSGNFSLTYSIRSFWNHLNWFPWNFLNQNNFHGIFHHETDFQETFQNKLVAWFSHQHILFSRSCKKIIFFFDFPVLKKVFSEFSLLELIFLIFQSEKSVSVVFLWTKFSVVDFSWMKIFFGIFNIETDFNGFPNNIFFLMELPLRITCFFGFLNNLNWLRFFFNDFFTGVFLDKIDSHRFLFDKNEFAMFPFQWLQFLAFFVLEIVFLDSPWTNLFLTDFLLN